METIILKPLNHRDMDCIGIYFAKNNLLQFIVQKQAGGKWSRTNQCWYIKLSQENYRLLATSLSGKAKLETEELKKFLVEKKGNTPAPSSPVQNKPVAKTEIKKDTIAASKPPEQLNQPHTLGKENKVALEQFNRQLILKGYSQSTIRTYKNEFIQFLNTIKDKPATDFSVSRLKDYLQYCHNSLKL